MFGFRRFFPLRAILLVALGFLLASAFAGGAGSAFAFAGFLVFGVIKLLFMLFLFGMLFRVIGGSFGPRGPWGGPMRDRGRGWDGLRHRHRHGRSTADSGRDRAGSDGSMWWYKGEPIDPPSATDGPADPEQQEWEEHLRQARKEVDDLDTPYRDAGTS
ncbi:MAG: hypothetical protein ACR2QO_00765 [Acidimicrobiales bacterium]